MTPKTAKHWSYRLSHRKRSPTSAMPNSKAKNRSYRTGIVTRSYTASGVAAWTTASAITVRPHAPHSNACESGCLARPGIPRERRIDLPQLGQGQILFSCVMESPTPSGAIYQIRNQGGPPHIPNSTGVSPQLAASLISAHRNRAPDPICFIESQFQRFVMSSLADEYRKYADECVTWAGHAKTVYACEMFLKMAQDWLRAAAQAKHPRVPSPGITASFYFSRLSWRRLSTSASTRRLPTSAPFAAPPITPSRRRRSRPVLGLPRCAAMSDLARVSFRR
jgi:hypothetical protein